MTSPNDSVRLAARKRMKGVSLSDLSSDNPASWELAAIDAWLEWAWCHLENELTETLSGAFWRRAQSRAWAPARECQTATGGSEVGVTSAEHRREFSHLHFPAPFLARLFEMTVAAHLSQRAFAIDFLLKSPQSFFDGFSLVNSYFRHWFLFPGSLVALAGYAIVPGLIRRQP